MKSMAQIAYEAYSDTTNGLSLATGDTLPGWFELPEKTQEAWGAAAQAVADTITPGGQQ